MYFDDNSHSHNHRSSFDDSFERSKERTNEEFDSLARQTSLANVFPAGTSRLFGGSQGGNRDHQLEPSYQHRTEMDGRLFGDSSSQQPFPQHHGLASTPSDSRLMVELDHERDLDNFWKGTELDIFNQADTPAYQGHKQLFEELNSDCAPLERSIGHHSHQQSLPFQHLAANHEGRSETGAIHGPFERRDPTISSGASHKSYTLPTGQSSSSLGSSGNVLPHSGKHSKLQLTAMPLQLQKQGSDEAGAQGTPAYHTSTNEYSADTYSRSKGTSGDQNDSLSDEEDAIYVPFEYKGDGRKREAKKHKLQALVAQDEIMIDRMIRDYQNSNEKIAESERALDMLRAKNISKKELQSKRNRLTAQLSRDRQKLEMSFLKAMCVNYQRLLRRLDKKLSDGASKPFCAGCWSNLNTTLQHHRSNQTQPTLVNFGPESESNEKTMTYTHARPDQTDEVEGPKTKRPRLAETVIPTESLSGSAKKPGSVSGRRDEKVNAKSNKGLIGASMMLSVVGMLNYMGNSEMPVCTQLDQKFHDPGTEDQFRRAFMQELKQGLYKDDFLTRAAPQMPQQASNDWSMENLDDRSYDAGYDADQYALDLVPAKPDADSSLQVNASSIMNRTTAAAGMTLEEAYVAFDMRESYLQRHASPMARYSDQTDLQINDFSTRTSNMWRSDDMNLFPDYSPPSCAHSGKGGASDSIYQAKYNAMEQNTQSMFCPTASLISPSYKDSNAPKALMHDKDGDGRHDVILEKDESGNTYLHLVMPATAVNFLNGSDGSSLFDFGEKNAFEEQVDDVFVELGCKVYEVNKVSYRGGELSRTGKDAHHPDSFYNASV